MSKKWVIGDIHGCVKTMISLIEDKIQPTTDDRIYFVGDYIDRGPNSKGVIDYIMMMRLNGYRVTTLRGNHEDMMLGAYSDRSLIQGWFYNGGLSTLNSFGIQEVRAVQGQYLSFLDSLDYYVELDDFIIVHAGLNFNIPNPLEDKHAMMWIRNEAIDISKVGNKRIIHGHTPVSVSKIKEELASHNDTIDLDSGCVYHGVEGLGNLCALELNSMTLEVQENLDVF